jgi:membrane-bound lytic murein transglycosylase D
MNVFKAVEAGLVFVGLVAGLGLGPSPAVPAEGAAPPVVATTPPVAVPAAPAPPRLATADFAPAGGGRHGAESPELRTLRAAEHDLFPLPGAPSPVAGGADPLDILSDRLCPPEGCREAAGADWLKDLKMPDLPVRPDEDIHRYVRFFSETTRGRKIFTAWLRRSGRYRGVVADAFRDRQLPQDLHALVFVESGYAPAAMSSAGAAGMFQFMSGTAKAYGLVVEGEVDERRDVRKASEAGAHHLQDLYERLGSWDLAFAAYNMGYQGILARMKELGTEDFWELAAMPGALPRETSLYVPKILAVALILRNLDRFGFDDVRSDPAVASAELEVPTRTPLSTIARAAGTSLETIRDLNPELSKATVPDRGIGGKVTIHVPASGLARARAMLPRLLDPLDRDSLEQRVSPSFDWGADELPHTKTNLLPSTSRAAAPPVVDARPKNSKKKG